MENVEVLPEPPVHTGALASSAITIIKVHKLLTSGDFADILPEPPVHTGALVSTITIIKVHKLLQSVDFVEILPGTCNRQITL